MIPGDVKDSFGHISHFKKCLALNKKIGYRYNNFFKRFSGIAEI